MFTGIIKANGKISQITRHHKGAQLKINTSLIKNIHSNVGDSIAVNGICLTVTKIFSDGFQVDIMPETTNRTTLDTFKPGLKVNLEPALLATDRIDGHFVLGHVDTTATLQKKEAVDNAWNLEFKINQKYAKYIIEKGSIALDGISLTIISTIDDIFTVSIIPHTIENTNLGNLQVGDLVNVETDILGKYILDKSEEI